MAAASCLLTEDQFLCSICLDVFTDPVTIPCGHNFCKTCITDHWKLNVQCQCPYCKKVFNTRPELQVNIFISEMAAQFRQSAQQKTSSSSSERQVSKPGDVPCDGAKLKALGKTEAETQQMIQIRRLKIDEIKRSVKLSNEEADREIADGVQVFTALKESVERKQAELIDTIKEKQRQTEIQAEGFIKELEQEISELRKRSTEVEQLSRSEDHLHNFRSSPSPNTAPPTKDWTKVSVHPPAYEGTVVRAVKQLEEMISQKMKKLFQAELMRVQRYTVNVTLDPKLVHPKPTQSNEREKGNQDNDCKCVLSKKAFTSGRFYFEVPVDTWSYWTLGVARKLTNMKEKITLSPSNGYWTVFHNKRGWYFASADPRVCLSLKSRPERVGVFVDYEEGLVSFYDVDAAALIYIFSGCCFSEKIYPFFSSCSNDGVKIHSSDSGCVLQ
ncbi:E3 ubiquitin-protein ligase TRIM39-like [Plectropomus leopardus]|uniref:E3 ubiquitin-protein ligase TRIM39-like n=1 Tax=Plectropomus leopardus TaxID=160734 RepID=UPI001C4B984E|nr:E3 ubiquitin-protein ligase TRIM39-like [Plectropomus leopardus]